MSTKIFLIRHGQTNWNYKRRYCGITDIDLNAKGKAHARQLSKRLRNEKIHKVYSSDMKRTLEFARIVFKEAPIKQLPELREMNFGVFEGLSYQEIMKKYPKIYTHWLNQPFSTPIPKGEDPRDFRKRIQRIFRKIVSLNKNRTVAIVTHSGPIRVIIKNILKLKDAWEIAPNSASITIIEIRRTKARIVLLNDISHCNG